MQMPYSFVCSCILLLCISLPATAAQLFVTRQGIVSELPAGADAEARLRVTPDFVARGTRPVRAKGAGRPMSQQVSSRAPLNGDETYLPVPSCGGWLGAYRYFQGVFLPPLNDAKVYETCFGRLSIDGAGELLSFPIPTELEISGHCEQSDEGWRIDYSVKAPETSRFVRALVIVDGIAEPQLYDSGVIELSARATGSMAKVWAIDEHGHTSSQPLCVKLQLPSVEPPVRPQWTIVSKEANVNGVVYQLSNAVAAARNQVMFAVGRANARQVGASRPSQPRDALLYFDEVRGQWHTVPTGGVNIGGLFASPDGAVYGTAAFQPNEVERPFYRVTKSAIYPISEFYNLGFTTDRQAVVNWNADSGLWNLGRRWVGRIDGNHWHEWELSIGHDGKLVAGPGGRVLIMADGRFWIGGKDGLSDAFELPSDWQSNNYGYLLDGPQVVVHCERRLSENRRCLAWAIYNTETEQLDTEIIGAWSVLRSDGRGNLFVWDSVERSLRRLSGEDLTVTEMPYIDLPSGTRHTWRPPGVDFIGTRNGDYVYVRDADSLFTWNENNGVTRHDWRQGIQSGNTHSIQEGPDGRVWITRNREIVIYDPEGVVTEKYARFEEWSEIDIASDPCRGFDGSVWAWKADLSGVIRFDGKSEQLWRIENVEPDQLHTVAVTTDNGLALVAEGRGHGRAWLLTGDRGVEQVDDLRAGVLKLIAAGAKRFHASNTYLPVVAKNGHIYFDGAIWNGSQWTPAKAGRPSLNAQGQLFVRSDGSRFEPRLYRLQEGLAHELPAPQRYLVDDYGLRAYDAELLKAEPDRYLLVNYKERRYELSMTPTSTPISVPARPIAAIATEEGEYFVSVKYRGNYLLNNDGLQLLDMDKIPFGGQLAIPHRLANGVWCWLLKKKLFISPENFVLGPGEGDSP